MPGEHEEQAKKESAKKPSKDDVHEQRESAQPREGAVRDTPATTPASPPRH